MLQLRRGQSGMPASALFAKGIDRGVRVLTALSETIELIEPTKNRIQGMVRSIDQYRNCDPKAIADGSYAQVLYALTDDKHDILVLWDFAVAAARKAAAMEREIADLREQMGYWYRGHERIEECLADAVKADPLDAPIPLIGVEAKRWHAYRAEAFRHALEMMGIPEAFRARALLSKESAEQDGSAITTKGADHE